MATLAAFALPAVAAAQTFVVNTGADAGSPFTPCNGVEECSLRQAIELADENEDGGVDRITFTAVPPGTHALLIESPLPAITEALRIEGDTAPEATPGVPELELAPNGAETKERAGLQVIGTHGTRIEGLAIGGFATGIEIAPEEGEPPLETQICGDYIGTEWLGEEARPNAVGIEIRNEGDERPEKTQIGGSGCAEDVISGNSVDGVSDSGLETTIAGSRIGIGANPGGAALGNGTPGDHESAGVLETAAASHPLIGGAGGLNDIDNNLGPGVLVENGAGEATIRGNSFSANEGKGIEIAQGAPPAPVITSAVSVAAGETTFKGTVEATTPGEAVQVEFFASDDCSKAGEGRTLLGSGTVANVGPGPTAYELTVASEPTPIEHGVTATATREAGATSEFSNCAGYDLARTFVVESLEDTETRAACEAGGPTCTLRGAIEAANATEAADTIDFGLAGTIEPSPLQLPEIVRPVVIDGTSVPGYAGNPMVEIKAVGATQFGLRLGSEAAGSAVVGLAIGGFGIGVSLEGAGQQVCGSYLGAEIDGTTALPNEYGIEVEGTGSGDEIGAGCEALGGGNLISGNAVAGIIDFGSGAQIADNRIGIDSNGGALPNGEGTAASAGIAITPGATGAFIGRVGLEDANVIAENRGVGVLVSRTLNATKIRGNSIYGNEGRGSAIAESPAPVSPIVSAVAPASGTVTIEGTATAAGDETIELDFFASASCSTATRGGQTFLGLEDVPGAGGATPYRADLDAPLPAGEDYVTATSTGSAVGETSEFSECFHYEAPPPGEQIFTVNSLLDTETALACEAADGPCTLRGAIEAANETDARDTIKFDAGAEGVIRVEGFPLPAITEPVVIEGSSAPGWAGVPLVEIDGTGASNEGPVRGLETTHGEAVIEGLAIGGFAEGGVYLGGTGDSQVCVSWLGIGLDGADLPNGTGVEVEAGSIGNTIGGGCGGVVYNYIAGNQGWGVKDFGRETQIGYDDIGISPAGSADGNGEGGILVGEGADETAIGSELGGAPGPNNVAYNDGPGVLVEEGSSRAAVRGNSIFGNEGKGIEIDAFAPAVPTIEAVEPGTGTGTITVKGAVTSGEEEAIELDVFASAVCSPLSAGEGESLLGHAEIALSTPGTNAFAATVAAPASDDQTFITVTATGALGHRTSEFSECFKYVPPGPEPEPEPTPEPEPRPEPKPEPEHRDETKSAPSDSGITPSATPTLDTAPTSTPTNGEKVVVKPEEGKVTIKLPGKKASAPLIELKEIPVGAVIDATQGRVTLTSVGPDGTEQTAEFFGGVFKVKQAEGSNLVVLELLDETACTAPRSKRGGKGKGGSPRAFASSVSARPSSEASGKLWGSGHGNFRTEGHDGSATVRGTIWLVEDRCDGTTFFKTRRGIVSVRDFILGKTLPLPAGKSYLAGEE